MINIYNNKSDIANNQDIYDSFNSFILSKDKNIFNKLYSRIKFYEMTKHLMGDIVECGVFKGSGLATWLKILQMNEPNSIKKVIGFDFFNPNFINDIHDTVDKKMMTQVFDRCQSTSKNDFSFDVIKNNLLNCGFDTDSFELVQGDISLSSKLFFNDKPGCRISILYLDLDLGDPTYNALNNMWDLIVDGGVIVFDEYAYHAWSESNGVDKFIKERNLKLQSTYIKAPTAFIIK